MFVCYECNEIFDELKHWEEKHGLDHGPYEIFAGCPYCGGAFTKTYQCDYCGEWINTNKYVEIGDERYCWDCVTIKKLEDI